MSDDQQEWDGVERRRLREWHLDRKVQLSHIFATAGVLVTLIGYMHGLEKDLALLKAEQAHARERADSQDKAIRQVIDSLDARLFRIEQGVEKLVDRYNAQPVKSGRG